MLLLVFVGTLSAVTAVPQHAPRATLDDVRFLLWTKSNSGDSNYQELKEGNLGSPGHFNGNDPTVVLIHGFANNGHSGWPVDGKTELLKLGSYNVIAVDWEKLAAAPAYLTAVDFVPQVGALTASLLDWLHDAAGMKASGVQVVGHSLGAHLSGAVGQNLNKFSLPFITGMDPAGPEFYEKPDSARLDKTDANFVQIIHTNAGGVLDGCVGLIDTMGHVDFFPNGGDHQPGCDVGGDWLDLLAGGCSHGRSSLYWIESINAQTTFYSHPCSDWDTYQAGGCSSCGQGCLDMGFHVKHSLRGTYYLATNWKKPFAQGDVRSSHQGEQ